MKLSDREQILALPWEQIVGKLPTRSKKVPGVYMLVNSANQEIDYIGQSVNIGSRLLSHHRPDLRYAQNYDLYILRIEEKESRLFVEARAICLLHSKMNKRNGIGLQFTSEEMDDEYHRIFDQI